MQVAKAKIPSEYQLNISDKTPECYPKKFFTLTMVGSSRSGKTTCIINFIQKLAKCYSIVVIFSPSSSDPIWTSLKHLPNVYLSDTVSNTILHKLFERQKALANQDKKKNHMLLVLDDFGGLAKQRGLDIGKENRNAHANEIVSSGIGQMLDVLYSRGRHNSTSIICSFHDTMSLTCLQRVNSTHWILNRLNEKQYEKIAPEIRCHLSNKEFIKMADEYTIKPYHFLYVDLKAHDNKDVFKQGCPAE